MNTVAHNYVLRESQRWLSVVSTHTTHTWVCSSFILQAGTLGQLLPDFRILSWKSWLDGELYTHSIMVWVTNTVNIIVFFDSCDVSYSDLDWHIWVANLANCFVIIWWLWCLCHCIQTTVFSARSSASIGVGQGLQSALARLSRPTKCRGTPIWHP